MFKFTKTEIYETVIALVEGAEIPSFAKKDGDTEVMVTVPSDVIVDRMKKDIEMASKKSSKTGKPTKTQVENETIKAQIISVLERIGKPMTVTQLLAESEFTGLSNQKVSALLTQLRKSGEVVRTIEKKVAFYSLPDEVEDTEEMGE